MRYGIYALQVVTITLALIFSFLMGVKYSSQVKEAADWIFAEPEYKVFKKVKRETIKPVKKPEIAPEKVEIKKDSSVDTKVDSIENMPEIVGEEDIVKDGAEAPVGSEVEMTTGGEKEESLNNTTSEDVVNTLKEKSEADAEESVGAQNKAEEKTVTPLELMEKANAQNTGNVKNSKSIEKAMEILN